MLTRSSWLLTSLAVLALLGCSESSEPPKDRPSLLLITIEALPADRLAILGGPLSLPAIESLASQGTLFRDAVTVAPMARPALATLHTGEAPDRHEVRNDTSDAVADQKVTLLEAFREAGYTTGCLVGSPFASYGSGLDQGCALFDGPDDLEVGPARFAPRVRSAEDVVGNTTQWIRSLSPGRPYAAWVHLADAHGIVTRPLLQNPLELYDQKIRDIDLAIGRLLEAAGPETEIWIVGTHGQVLEKEGARGSSYWLRAETLGIPLIVRGQEWGRGEISDTPAWLPDVPATIAARFGLALPSADGIDLRRQTVREPRKAWTWAPEEEYAWAPLTAQLQDGAWIQMEGASAQRPAVARRRKLSPETREMLAELGIRLGTETGLHSSLSADRTDAYLSRMSLLRHLLAEWKPKRADVLSEELLAQDPGNLAALLARLYFVVSAEHASGATPLAAELLERYPERAEALHWAAHAWFLKGDIRKAEALVRAAVEVGPGEADMFYDLACARALSGDVPGGLRELRAAVDKGFRNWPHIERDPDLASLRADPGYAEILKAHGR